jgi:LEA14-like dessication related protein
MTLRTELPMRSPGRLSLLLALLALLAGCFGIPTERPRVNIANVTLKEVKLLEQIYDMELRIQNPNDTELIINGLAFELLVNDKTFATGMTSKSLTVPPFSSSLVTVETISPLSSIIRQIVGVQKSGLAKISYRLKGAVYIGSASLKLGFDEQGEIELPVPKAP